METHSSHGMGCGRARRSPPTSTLTAALVVATAAVATAVVVPVAQPALAFEPGVRSGDEPALPVLDIGALVTLGDMPFSDDMRLEAIRLAVDDYNRNATKSFSIHLYVHEFDRSAPVESYRAAFGGGAGPLLFIGPTTSAPVAAIAGPATADGAVIVSPTSSAMSLAVAGDAVLRLSPDGYLQASAIASMVDDAGAGAAILAAQDDTYGRDLASSLAGVLPLRGISAGDAIFFERGEERWGGTVAALDAAVSSAKDPAVVFIGVDEDFAGLAAEAHAGGYPALAKARWFDSGAVENSPLVAADPAAAAFAESVGFATPVPSPPPTDLSRRIDRVVGAATGGSPHMFEYGAYDAVFLLAAAAESAGFPGAPIDGPAVGAALPAVAGTYVGALGDVRLDGAGDLVAPDDHAVWSLRGGEWERTGTVHAAREADENRALAAEAAAAAAEAAGGAPSPAAGGGGGGCLVATAAYGTELAPQVQHLREIRDRAVERSDAGSYAVHVLSAAYYSFSPAAADALRGHPALSAAADALLIEPVVMALSLGGHAEPPL